MPARKDHEPLAAPPETTSGDLPGFDRTRRLWRGLELTVLFVLFPIGLYFVRTAFGRLIVPTLLVSATVCGLVLLRDPSFERRRLGFPAEWKPALRDVLATFVPGAALITVLTLTFRADLFLGFPRRDTFWWAVVMVAYPLLSVYPQEILFRTFFFHRYRRLLGSQRATLLWSALVFGLAHLFFANWVAPTLTAVGGYLFARTYARTGSTVVAALEHALWGDFLFTLGLGWYFWGGSIRAMSGAAGVG